MKNCEKDRKQITRNRVRIIQILKKRWIYQRFFVFMERKWNESKKWNESLLKEVFKFLTRIL